jgi:hypothetical protein
MNIIKAKKTLKAELADMKVSDGLIIDPKKENSYRTTYQKLSKEPEYSKRKWSVRDDEQGHRRVWRVA